LSVHKKAVFLIMRCFSLRSELFLMVLLAVKEIR